MEEGVRPEVGGIGAWAIVVTGAIVLGFRSER
jgi:hypothetical protein